MSDPASAGAGRRDPEFQPSSREAQASRIEAMLDRWESEDCSGEPDWDVDALAPLRLGAPSVGAARQGDKP